MKYYLIAGEASGDLHGANLMKALKQKDPHANFRFWGGNKMAAVGGNQVEHYKNTAFMGFWEVITNLRKIFSYLSLCKSDITSYQPDVIILIDYPGFNLRIAEWAKQNTKSKIVYYISPQVWAWKENRVNKIKRSVDKLLVILPFEKEFYRKHNYEVEFVGHPLLDEIETFKMEVRSSKLEQQNIVLLPGSRKQEIKKMLPIFLKVTTAFPKYKFIVAGLSHNGTSFYDAITADYSVEVIYDQTYQLLTKARAAIVTSGTATLETALFNVPMVVCYKGSWLSYQIGKRLVNIEFIALVNLIMGKKVVEELIQTDLTVDNLSHALNAILNTNTQQTILDDYIKLKEKLGNSGASERAANIIISNIEAN